VRARRKKDISMLFSLPTFSEDVINYPAAEQRCINENIHKLPKDREMRSLSVFNGLKHDYFPNSGQKINKPNKNI